MLNKTRIEKFFDNYPKGFIELVQCDGKNFCLEKGISYSLDETSITFHDITYTTKKCGNSYVKKGDFTLPFSSIIRIEYIQYERE